MKEQEINWKIVEYACKTRDVFKIYSNDENEIVINDVSPVAIDVLRAHTPRDVCVDAKKECIKFYKNSQVMTSMSEYSYPSNILLTFNGGVLSGVSI